MNIAISFSGEGFGHAARISGLSKQLRKEHNLEFWCPLTVKGFFEEKNPWAKVNVIPWVGLLKKNHRVRAWATGIVNVKSLFFSQKKVNEIARELINKKIDIIISDYEPFLSKAAKKAKIPILLFNHQNVIYDYPSFSFSYFINLVGNTTMMPHGDKKISSSFFNGDVGPLLRDEVITAKQSTKDFYVVYVKPAIKKKLLPVLEQFPEVNFQIFPDRERKLIPHLASCKGVIAAAGHQLISECLSLNKPMLVIPERQQYEQQLNAKMLEKIGRGKKGSLKSLYKDIKEFIETSHTYPLSTNHDIKVVDFDDSKKAAKLVNEFIRSQLKKKKK